MNSARYFIRREDDEPRRTPADSPFRRFIVRCLKCDSHQLRALAEFDEGAGEVWIMLRCLKCGECERVAAC